MQVLIENRMTIPKVTLKVMNQGHMFFADFSANSKQIFKKIANTIF